MSGHHYRVSWAMQQAAAADIRQAMDALDNELAEVNRQVAQLISTWDSDAKVVYHQRQQVWDNAAFNIKNALGVFEQKMHSAAAVAAAAESAAAATVGGGR